MKLEVEKADLEYALKKLHDQTHVTSLDRNVYPWHCIECSEGTLGRLHLALHQKNVEILEGMSDR